MAKRKKTPDILSDLLGSKKKPKETKPKDSSQDKPARGESVKARLIVKKALGKSQSRPMRDWEERNWMPRLILSALSWGTTDTPCL